MSAVTQLPLAASPQRTFVALMEDKPGVLNRVVSLFRRRNFNIVSLNVGRTHMPGVSRMTAVVEADEQTGRRIEANLYKLVNILRVDDITDRASVVRDLALVKVRAPADRRAEVTQIADLFRARIVDVAQDSLMLEITGTHEKIQGCIELLRPIGIAEMVQTGTVAMTRGRTA